MRFNIFLLLLLLVIVPVQAERPAKKKKPNGVLYTINALAEMLLPMQLHACQAAYPEMHDSTEALFGALPYDARQDPEKQPKITQLRSCFTQNPPLTLAQCQSIVDKMSRLAVATKWSSAERQLGLDYLSLSKQTQAALENSVDRCLYESGEE